MKHPRDYEWPTTATATAAATAVKVKAPRRNPKLLRVTRLDGGALLYVVAFRFHPVPMCER